MITRLTKMTRLRRFMSSALLIVGVALVFAGFSASLGFTPAGILAGVAAIVSLLYAGAAWFGRTTTPAAAGEPIVVFDRTLRVVCSAAHGRQISAHFPAGVRDGARIRGVDPRQHLAAVEIERRCAAALLGDPSHFTCAENGQVVDYDVAPVRGVDGTVLCVVLIAGMAAPAPAAAACIAS